MMDAMLGATQVSYANSGIPHERVGDVQERLRLPDGRLSRLNRVLLLAASFFLSWHLLRLPSVNFNISDAAFLAGCILLLFTGKLNLAIFGRSTGVWVSGVMMMLGGLLIGTIDHGEVTRWYIISSQYVLALIVIPAVLVSMNRQNLERAGIAFVLGAALSQFLGIIALRFFSYDQLLPFFGRTFLRGNGRLGAMAGEPNSNGAVCVFALIMLINATLDGRIRKRIAFPIGLTIVAGLVASASFTALAASVVSIGALILLTRFSALWKIGVPVILLALTYYQMGGPLPHVFDQRVGDAVITMNPAKAGTFTGRTELIKEAWHKADDNLLIGLGADRYREVSTMGAPVHNLYLLMLNEGGLLSFLGLTILTCCLFINALLLLRFNRLDGAACLAIATAFTFYCASMPHLYDRLWTVPVMLLFSISMAPRFLPAPAWLADVAAGEAGVPDHEEAGLQ